jgi:hypothetical protein
MNDQLTRQRDRHKRGAYHSPMLRQRLAAAVHLLAGWLRMHAANAADARMRLHFFRFSDFVSPGVAPVRVHARTTSTTGWRN